jgi:hypothetical protein
LLVADGVDRAQVEAHGIEHDWRFESATFRRWLVKHHCSFDTDQTHPGTGRATVHRAGRKEHVGDLNANCDLSRQFVCEALTVESTISTDHRIVWRGGLAK